MNDAADNWDKYKLLEETNEGDYHATANPCGWDADGLPENLSRFSKAVAGVGKEVRTAVATAMGAANQNGAWKRLEDEGSVAIVPVKLADNQVAAPGDWLTLLAMGRAVRPSVTSPDSGWIESVEYDAPNDRTVATVTGWTVDAGISELWFGQDPANAPRQEDPTGADIALAEFYDYFDY